MISYRFCIILSYCSWLLYNKDTSLSHMIQSVFSYRIINITSLNIHLLLFVISETITSTNTSFFPKLLTTFLTSFSRRERGKYAEQKLRLNWGLNSQPPGHESDKLTTEPPWQGQGFMKEVP